MVCLWMKLHNSCMLSVSQDREAVPGNNHRGSLGLWPSMNNWCLWNSIGNFGESSHWKWLMQLIFLQQHSGSSGKTHLYLSNTHPGTTCIFHSDRSNPLYKIRYSHRICDINNPHLIFGQRDMSHTCHYSRCLNCNRSLMFHTAYDICNRSRE